ncbi:unnamed protein product [Symbiodinium natans]|uniref:Uncharacterized protein n=1 Tax=Symbiodinium natans TaxID=878477 RepID=A0A812I7E8_9DINO|nr:unnamed protein product [Symbiodinium natans]CAE7214521.1 unnamed protein product [Symbiodinium natans]
MPCIYHKNVCVCVHVWCKCTGFVYAMKRPRLSPECQTDKNDLYKEHCERLWGKWEELKTKTIAQASDEVMSDLDSAKRLAKALQYLLQATKADEHSPDPVINCIHDFWSFNRFRGGWQLAKKRVPEQQLHYALKPVQSFTSEELEIEKWNDRGDVEGFLRALTRRYKLQDEDLQHASGWSPERCVREARDVLKRDAMHLCIYLAGDDDFVASCADYIHGHYAQKNHPQAKKFSDLEEHEQSITKANIRLDFEAVALLLSGEYTEFDSTCSASAVK